MVGKIIKEKSDPIWKQRIITNAKGNIRVALAINQQGL